MLELIDIQRDLKAPKNQFNGFGKYKYRSCEDILEALKPHLAEHKCHLTVSDDVRLVGDRYYIEATATITNSKGESLSCHAFAREAVAKKGMDESQITGSASSYSRKYALNGLFAIDDNKDADHAPQEPQKKPVSVLVSDIKGAPDMAALKAIFGGYWTNAPADQKEQLKAAYETKKAEFEQ